MLEAQFHTLFRRCVTGCSQETPSCPSCSAGEVCQLSPVSCDACQSTSCVASSAAITTTTTTTTTTAVSQSSKSTHHSETGAIAGGVIGGVIAIAIVTYLVWRFCIKPKRQQYEEDTWLEGRDDAVDGMPTEKDFTMRRDARASTHTVASIASTVLTRASNIIQIAYIPGVTNRSAPSTPGLLVPPVPPIPIALSSAASSPRYEDEHFFMPGDLRDSTYSTLSDRTSYARNSVASTIYGKNAVVSPVPAQTVIRGRAAVVSVKSAGAQHPGEMTPPVPNVDYGKYAPPSPAFSVGSTFLNNASVSSASAATQMKPQVVSVSSGKKAMPLSAKSPHQSLMDRDSTAATLIDDSPALDQGPFRDPPATPNSSASLSAIIEEATRKAHGDVKGGLGTRESQTPFGDEHEMRD